MADTTIQTTVYTGKSVKLSELCETLKKAIESNDFQGFLDEISKASSSMLPQITPSLIFKGENEVADNTVFALGGFKIIDAGSLRPSGLKARDLIAAVRTHLRPNRKIIKFLFDHCDVICRTVGVVGTEGTGKASLDPKTLKSTLAVAAMLRELPPGIVTTIRRDNENWAVPKNAQYSRLVGNNVFLLVGKGDKILSIPDIPDVYVQHLPFVEDFEKEGDKQVQRTYLPINLVNVAHLDDDNKAILETCSGLPIFAEGTSGTANFVIIRLLQDSLCEISQDEVGNVGMIPSKRTRTLPQ